MHLDEEYPYSSSRLWLGFPYKKMAGAALGGYKRRPPPPLKNNTFREEEVEGLHQLVLLG
jgi:hypothetical protein